MIEWWWWWWLSRKSTFEGKTHEFEVGDRHTNHEKDLERLGQLMLLFIVHGYYTSRWPIRTDI